MTVALSFDPSFPPLLTSRPVVPPIDPLDAAVEAARRGAGEAGDLFWSCDTTQISCAVLLEPDVERARVQEMLFVAMTAMADAIGALCPPELAITWRWPHAVYANGARLGEARMVVCDEEDAEGSPLWMAVALRLALTPTDTNEPGRTPDRTTLWDEGAVELEALAGLESLSRHFLTWVHRWEVDGFKPVHEAWLFRCDGYREDVAVRTNDRALQGTFTGLDESGNLLLKEDGEGAPVRILNVADHLDDDRTARPLASVTEI